MTKRRRESKKAEKAEQKRLRRAERKEGGLRPPEEPDETPEGDVPQEEPTDETT